MKERVREALRELGVRTGDRMLACVSGGADSVCLLVLAAEIGAEDGLAPEAVHVNHGLRGAEADADEELVRQLCEERGVPLHVVRADVAGEAEARHLSLEEAGREVRYRVFLKTAVERNICWILTAHHMNDNAETVLYRLCRGTGLSGLAGIPAVRELAEGIRVIRPLLSCSHEEICEELRARGVAWREDASNEEGCYARNVIRGQVMPVLEARINERSAEHIAAAAQALREVWEYLGAEAEGFLAEKTVREDGALCVDAQELAALPAALAVEVLRRMIGETCGLRDVGAVHLEAVRSLAGARTGAKVSLPGGGYAERAYEKIAVRRGEEAQAPAPRAVTVPGRYELPDGQVLVLERKTLEKGDTFPKIPCETWLDYATINDAIFLRSAQEGDWLVCDREGHKKSLNRWFIDQKVPRAKREKMPVLACGSHVLWIVGERASMACMVTDTTREVLAARVERPAPRHS